MYGSSEQEIGLLLNELKRRDSLFSATKVWTNGKRGGEAADDAFTTVLGHRPLRSDADTQSA